METDTQLPNTVFSNMSLREESNQIRTTYQTIRDELRENHMNYVDPTSESLELALNEVENNFKRVKKPREAVSDSHVLLQLAILGKERIKNVHCEFRSFNNNEFIDKMKAYMAAFVNKKYDEEDDEDYENQSQLANTSYMNSSIRTQSTGSKYILTKQLITRFGTRVSRYFKMPLRPTFLIGSLNKELVISNKRAPYRRVDRQEVEAMRTKITELNSNTNTKEANSTASEVERVFKILVKYYKKLKGEPLCFYEFVVNPESFSKTIENIFYVSFLIKDGYAKMYLDGANLPVIEPLEEGPQTSETSNKTKKSITNIQSMVQMTQIEWKEIIEAFNIQRALIR